MRELQWEPTRQRPPTVEVCTGVSNTISKSESAIADFFFTVKGTFSRNPSLLCGLSRLKEQFLEILVGYADFHVIGTVSRNPSLACGLARLKEPFPVVCDSCLLNNSFPSLGKDYSSPLVYNCPYHKQRCA